MPWQAITYVSSGFTLVAFIVATAAWVLKNKSDEKRNLIESAPDINKSELVDKALDLVHVNTDGLSQEKRYNLAMELIKRRAERFRIVAIVVCILAMSGMSFAFYSNSKIEDSDETTITPEPESANDNEKNDQGAFTPQSSEEIIEKIRTILTPPFSTKVSRFTHGPSDCIHHAVETLSVNDFKVDLNGLTCSYTVNKHNTGTCRGLPFDEDRPAFHGQVVAKLAVQNNRINIFDIEDNYPSDLEQDTKAGSPLVNFFKSKNYSILKE